VFVSYCDGFPKETKNKLLFSKRNYECWHLCAMSQFVANAEADVAVCGAEDQRE
jgi:hypothetical protein